jgi:hypothetical protein
MIQMRILSVKWWIVTRSSERKVQEDLLGLDWDACNALNTVYYPRTRDQSCIGKKLRLSRRISRKLTSRDLNKKSMRACLCLYLVAGLLPLAAGFANSKYFPSSLMSFAPFPLRLLSRLVFSKASVFHCGECGEYKHTQASQHQFILSSRANAWLEQTFLINFCFQSEKIVRINTQSSIFFGSQIFAWKKKKTFAQTHATQRRRRRP